MLKSGVSVLDVALPEGVPRRAFIVVGGEAGTGKTVLLTELAWRALERGEHVIYAILENDPLAVLTRFKRLKWNLDPYIKKEKFTIFDGFSHILNETLRKRKKITSPRDDMLRNCVTRFDPTRMTTVVDAFYSVLEASQDLGEEAFVVFDSLTELFSLLAGETFFDTLKQLRAMTLRAAAPFICAAHYGVVEKFPSTISYLADGLIDLRFQPQLMQQGILVKQIRIRRMSGVKSFPIWLTFDVEHGQGIVLTLDYARKIQEEMKRILYDMGLTPGDLRSPELPPESEDGVS
ncbi:MAG: RAD55 family ATPase [Promethearchaeota archaeon]